jgi:hypothetical protein
MPAAKGDVSGGDAVVLGAGLCVEDAKGVEGVEDTLRPVAASSRAPAQLVTTSEATTSAPASGDRMSSPVEST